ncbi:MAG: 4-vinyl reductase, partial [Thermostichales cyanobacterium HHBFW_bins_127]
SPFSSLFPGTPQRPMGYLEAGMLAAWFSQLTGRDLNCVQTTSIALGAPVDTFVITAAERLKDAEAWVEAGESHDQILAKLCQS